MKHKNKSVEDMTQDELTERIAELEKLGSKITSRQANELRELKAARWNIRTAMRAV